MADQKRGWNVDDDGRLMGAGDQTLSYDPNGLLSDVTAGNVAEHGSVNQYGEVVKTSATTGSSALFDTVTARDKLGRVTSRAETIQKEVHKLEYRYDVRGRLIEVLRDDASTAYSYDKLAKEAKRTGVTPGDAEALIDRARGAGVPAKNHVGTNHRVGGDHIHVGPIQHIPVVP